MLEVQVGFAGNVPPNRPGTGTYSFTPDEAPRNNQPRSITFNIETLNVNGDRNTSLHDDVRPAVVSFAWEMEKELKLNDHKGHWGNVPLSELLDHLKKEVAELEEAVTQNFSPESVLSEAADTANMALMVADVYAKNYVGSHGV